MNEEQRNRFSDYHDHSYDNGTDGRDIRGYNELVAFVEDMIAGELGDQEKQTLKYEHERLHFEVNKMRPQGRGPSADDWQVAYGSGMVDVINDVLKLLNHFTPNTPKNNSLDYDAVL
jgi:hypothetical protein